MLISVIIPSKNRSEQLLNCLQALQQQNAEQGLFEVIVIDDESDSSYSAVKKAIEHMDNTRYSRHKHTKGAASARNTGAAIAKGSILAFTDDDCQPDRNWIRSIQQYFVMHKNIIAVGGSVKPMNNQNRMINSYLSYIKFLDGAIYKNGIITNMATANLAVRRSSFELIGGFDESFQFSEDQNLVYRLSKIGVLGFCEKILVLHNHNITFRQFYKKYQNYGRGVCQHLLSTGDSLENGNIYQLYCNKTKDIYKKLPMVFDFAKKRIKSQEGFPQLRLYNKICFYFLSLVQEACFQYGATTVYKREDEYK